jgi:hypothetical protein
MPRVPLSLLLLSCGLASGGIAFAQTPPPPEQAAPAPAPAEATQPAPPADAPAPVAPTPAVPRTDEEILTVFRHDLINLIVLSADGRKLAAAAQIAAPDQNDPARSELKKPPGLIKRAQQFAPNDPFVVWVAASNPCMTKPGCADPAALATMQKNDADNAAVWLRTFPAEGNPAKAQAIVARMAQAQRYDDYWAADVVALYHALETMPVPEIIRRQGMSTQAARVNFASSMASAMLPIELKQLAKFCGAVDATKDAGIVADCLNVAKKLETSGTFISQNIGFGIEDHFVTGTDREVLGARQRSAAWQREKFLEIAARFNREPALAESYIRLLGSEQNELAAVPALLREEKIHTDPPGGWQPPQAKAPDPLQAPAAQH